MKIFQIPKYYQLIDLLVEVFKLDSGYEADKKLLKATSMLEKQKRHNIRIQELQKLLIGENIYCREKTLEYLFYFNRLISNLQQIRFPPIEENIGKEILFWYWIFPYCGYALDDIKNNLQRTTILHQIIEMLQHFNTTDTFFDEKYILGNTKKLITNLYLQHPPITKITIFKTFLKNIRHDRSIRQTSSIIDVIKDLKIELNNLDSKGRDKIVIDKVTHQIEVILIAGETIRRISRTLKTYDQKFTPKGEEENELFKHSSKLFLQLQRGSLNFRNEVNYDWIKNSFVCLIEKYSLPMSVTNKTLINTNKQYQLVLNKLNSSSIEKNELTELVKQCKRVCSSNDTKIQELQFTRSQMAIIGIALHINNKENHIPKILEPFISAYHDSHELERFITYTFLTPFGNDKHSKELDISTQTVFDAIKMFNNFHEKHKSFICKPLYKLFEKLDFFYLKINNLYLSGEDIHSKKITILMENIFNEEFRNTSILDFLDVKITPYEALRDINFYIFHMGLKITLNKNDGICYYLNETNKNQRKMLYFLDPIAYKKDLMYMRNTLNASNYTTDMIYTRKIIKEYNEYVRGTYPSKMELPTIPEFNCHIEHTVYQD